MGRTLRYQSETAWFVLAGTLDYLLTYTLLYCAIITGAPAYEANPVAARLLEAFGEHGMLALKMSVLAFVSLAVDWIGRHNDRLARRLLWFGIALYGSCATVGLFLIRTMG
jgi:hypothetical protein